MAIEKWVAGAVSTATTCFNAADLNSLPSGDAIMSGIIIDNTSNFDEYLELSIKLGSVTTVAPNYIGVFGYPLNIADATTYGDGALTAGTQAAVTPNPMYWLDNIIVPVGTQALSGTSFFKIQPIKMRLVLFNQAGVAWAASGNSASYQTFNRSVA